MKKPVIVFDLETSIDNHSIGKFKASPFYEQNRIVSMGSWEESTGYIERYAPEHLGQAAHIEPMQVIDDHLETSGIAAVDGVTLVAHNAKFDLLYLMNRSEDFKNHFKHCDVWDTMLAQYLIEGQSKAFPSLDYTAPQYGGVLKDEYIKTCWEGTGSKDELQLRTEEIPRHRLMEYMQHDVMNCVEVYRGQIEACERIGIMELVKTQMSALKATTFMEYNGMQFDLDQAWRETQNVKRDLAPLESYAKDVMIALGFVDPNPLSNDQLGAAIFGGQIKYDAIEEVMGEDGQPYRFKTGKKKGQIKTRKIVEKKFVPGFKQDVRSDYRTDTGKFKVNDYVLKNIISETSDDNLIEFLTTVIKIRELTKDMKTYYIGYSDLVWNDGRIHGSLNHVKTRTGRLSSSSPNLQNVSNKQ